MQDPVEAPELLDIPPKLLPLLTEFNNYKIFIIEGGRGSGKTQSIARILLWLAVKYVLRIVCGREIQSTIEESVYTVLRDLILKFSLAFQVAKTGIRCLLHESMFIFKGFREQGSINIKGIEGADILWVDEAQGITRQTLDYILPTLRKDSGIKIIFTMNRLFRDDAVMELVGRDDVLHIHIDYFENPHCPATLMDEAERMKNSNPREYRHIWLGEPTNTGDDYLFDFDKLYDSLNVVPYGELFYPQRIMSIDFAAQGADHNINLIFDRVTVHHWQPTEFIKWHEPDTTISVGKIIHNIGTYKPHIVIIDVGGMGWNVYCDLLHANLANVLIIPFNGGSTDKIDQMSTNKRADAYWLLREWYGHGWIKMDERHRYVLKQLEKIRKRFPKSGKRLIQEKTEYKSENGFSPDEADALMQAVYAAVRHLGEAATSNSQNNVITRKSGSKRKR